MQIPIFLYQRSFNFVSNFSGIRNSSNKTLPTCILMSYQGQNLTQEIEKCKIIFFSSYPSQSLLFINWCLNATKYLLNHELLFQAFSYCCRSYPITRVRPSETMPSFKVQYHGPKGPWLLRDNVIRV